MDTVPIIIATGCVLVLVGLWIAWRMIVRRAGHKHRSTATAASPAELAEQSAQHQRNLTQLLHRYHGESAASLHDTPDGDRATHDLNA